MPGSITADGKETELLTSFARGLRDAGFHTLQVGKPGIDFHTGWDLSKIAYDKALYERTTWQDLLDNVADAIAYVADRRPCAASKLVLVGHSEGTMRVADVAARDVRVRGLVLLGFQGSNVRDMIEWQAFRRPVELFVRTDVDADHDGFISRVEAARWPKDVAYAWKADQPRVSIAEYAESLRANADYAAAIDALAKAPLYSGGIWDRPAIFEQVARLRIPVLAFTGTKDVMTPPSELEALRAACVEARKRDCETVLVPGLGHGMSPPRAPRAHPLLDQTEGPVDEEFLVTFTRRLREWRSRVR